tara:strand:+ start:721 stop:1410 length:690 start_codon:yes stop_codon:yes gene_type:complete
MIQINLREKLSHNSKWFISPLLLLLLACPSEDEPPDPEPDHGPLIASGFINLASGFYEDALDNFDDALSLSRTNISANMGKAWSMLFLDNGVDGSSLDSMRFFFEKGIGDSIWSADAYCGLAMVALAQNNYSLSVNHADSLLSINSLYVFEYVNDIDYHDILLVKAQAQFFTSDYQGAYDTLSLIDSVYDIDSDWVVNDISHFSFESALTTLIELLTSEYDSGGFISNP